MRSAQAGDAHAYEQLLKEILPLVHSIVRRRVHNTTDGESVVQEVLLSLHRARATYDPSRAFMPWIFAIATHCAVDHARRS
jgi:RNA polymerase sigma-70 factor, ECF subfamily